MSHRPPKTAEPRRWTVGRVATDLAIIMVAVPIALLDLAAPRRRAACAMTDEFDRRPALGLLILTVRASWSILKALNDAAERWLDLPNSPYPAETPNPGRPLTP